MDEDNKRALDVVLLEQAANRFAAEFLRHLAHGSSWYDLVKSMQNLHEAMAEVGNWKDIGDIITECWRLELPEQTESFYEDIDYWRESAVQPALRIAACQFASNPIQKHKSKEMLFDCFKHIERIRAENRKRWR